MTPTRVALVTGAGSGIGRAVSLALNSAGYSVVLAGRRAAELDRTAAMADHANAPMIAVPTDITQPDAVAALFARTKEAFGRLDVLFNNAGRSRHSLGRSDPCAVERGCGRQPDRRVLVRPAGHPPHAVAAAPAAGASLIMDRSPRTRPAPTPRPTTATKHAITGLTKSISLDGRKYDIACGQIDIGNAATEMTERMSAGVAQADGTKAPEPRIDVQLVAGAVLYMANLPLDANVQFMTVMATTMPFIGRG